MTSFPLNTKLILIAKINKLNLLQFRDVKFKHVNKKSLINII